MSEQRDFCPVTKVDDLSLAIGFETVKADMVCKSCGFLYSSDREGEYKNSFEHKFNDIVLEDFQCLNCFNTKYDIILYGYLAFGKCIPKEDQDV